MYGILDFIRGEPMYKILDLNGNIVDRHLSFEEALLWADGTNGDSYHISKEEDDQDDCSSLQFL